MTKTLESLINRYMRREEFGLRKYGTTMDRRDLSPVAWAGHLHDELMDASLYVERLRYALLLLEDAKAIIEAGDPGHVAAVAWMVKYREQFGGEG